MPYQKLFVVVGLLGVATCLRAQQPINPPSPVPQAVTTPFIADPTQAETPRAKAVPRAKPDLSFPASPIAQPTQQPAAAPPPAGRSASERRRLEEFAASVLKEFEIAGAVLS